MSALHCPHCPAHNFLLQATIARLKNAGIEHLRQRAAAGNSKT